MRSFNVIAAKNFGEKADVLSKTSHTLGQAAISINANALNGNLFIKDHMFTYVDRGVHLKIGMVYNSQSAQPWKLNLGKQITDVKNVNTTGSKITLVEEDGSKTVFAYDETRKCYVEVGATNGARTLTYDGKQWQGFNPATGARETYDQSQKLAETAFLDGASVEYHHDSKGKLTAVRSTSGQYIEIEYVNNEIKLWHHQDGERKLWVTYTFDEQMKLTKSTIPVSETESYVTDYEHDQKTGLLRYVTQSDSSKIEFDYVQDESGIKICTVKDGEDRKYSFDHRQPQQVDMKDPLGYITTYRRDEQSRLKGWNDGVHRQTFQYDQLERLEKITYADDTSDKFEFDDLGFRKRHEDRNGDATFFSYDKETGVLVGIKRESAITTYYYNAKRQLRYEVTPMGGVIEYQYDQLGNRVSKRTYLEATFELGTDLEAWLKTVDKKKVALTEWQHHANGMVAKEIRYATIDENGKGVFDEYAAEETYEWDAYGNCLKTVKKVDELTHATTKTEYDGLSRIVESKDAIDRVTRHTYRGLSHTIASLATGHEEIIRKDKSGCVIKQVERADSTVRQATHLLDRAGRCYATQHDDGSKTYFVYDAQNRKRFGIDAEKRVTEYRYDTNDNVTHTIRYAQPIAAVDEEGLWKGDWIPAVTDTSLVERKYYDAESRLRYTIDGENFVTEYRYDTLGNISDKIIYATICPGEPPAATLEKDRRYRYFYNKDGSKQAEQTPGGHVIVYVRNKRGDLREKKSFVTPQKIEDALDIDKLISSKMDEKDSYLLDARGQCIEHTDAEEVATHTKYDAGGRVKSTKKETFEVEFEHDELGRVKSESHSTGLEIERTYHPNGELCYEVKSDRDARSESQELYLQYNGFGEQTKSVTDKASIATLVGKEPKMNVRSRQTFNAIVEKVLGDKKDKCKGLSLWKELYFHLVTEDELNKDNAAIILDEMERQAYYFSLEAEKDEKAEYLIQFVSLYCAALRVFILKGSWHTYFFGGKWSIEKDNKSLIPFIFHSTPHSLDHAKEILDTVSSIPKTNDLVELQSLKTKLVEIRKLLSESLGSKGFWRHDDTHSFYDKTVKTLNPLVPIEKDAAVKIDEENIYSSDGLLLATRDVAGYTTHYYYDALRRPIFIVRADCSIIAKKYDAYSDHVEVTCSIGKFMSKEDKAGLTGGQITPEILALFVSLKSDKDILVTEKCDKRQMVVEKIDGEEFSEVSTISAFGELEKHTKQINKEKPEVTTDQFEHDKAGRLVKVTCDVDGLAIVETTQYNDELGEEVHTDGNGGQEKRYHDRLHRLVKLIDAHGSESTTEWDGLSRINAEINQLKQRTRYEWSSDGRVVKKVAPTGTVVTERDAFGLVTQVTRSMSEAQPIKVIKHYDDHGRVCSIQDAHGETTFLYDSRGEVEFEVLPSGAMTKYIRDELGRVKEQIDDFGGLNRSIKYSYDSHGRKDAECNGEGIWTKRGFNKRSEEIETIIDPTGLHLLTRKHYDGLGKSRSKTQGDGVVEDQYHQTMTVDHLGRCISESIDPAGLDIRTSNTFDAVGNITSITDANDRVTWLCHDALSRERFHLSPEGEVAEKQYDALGRCVMERVYVKSIKSDDYAKYKLKDWEQKAAEIASPQDFIIHHIYDLNQHPRFRVRLLREPGKPLQGVVEEFVYDGAEREIKHVRYAQLIDLSGDKAVKEQLDAQIDVLRSHANNRALRRWYDQASQERYIIDQSGCVTETRYDKNGKATQVIRYAKAIDVKALNESASLADVAAAITLSVSTDRVTNYVYDNLGRKIFKVSPIGYVKKYEYDNNNKRTSVCRFKERVDIEKAYDELVKVLKELKPDPQTDSITTVKYDHAGRIEKTVDAFKCEDSFEYDALSNVRFHTDKKGKKWEQQFDRAKRMVKSITPPDRVAHVSRKESGQLSIDLKVESVTTRKDYYPDDTTKSIIKGEGLPEERVVNFKMNSKGALLETQVPKAVVDNPAASSSLSTLPVQQKDIKTSAIYNHLQKEVAKQDESGNWSYTAYDALGRAIFEVNREGAIIQYGYNAFDELTEIKQYGVKIMIDHDEFSKVNFSCEYLLTMLKSDKTDRTTTFVRDKSGNVEELVQDAVDLYVDGLGRACPTTKRRFNTSGKCISESKLIKPGCWAEKATWYDKSGMVVAEIDEEQYLTVYERDAPGNIVKRHEYANPLKSRPDASSPFEELQKGVVESSFDRHFEFVYKHSDKPSCIIQKNAITHKLVIGAGGKPELVAQQPRDLCKTVEYDAAGNMTALVHEDGARDEFIYNAQGLLIAEVGASRDVFNLEGKSSKLRPVTVYHYNAFGEIVATRRLKTGFPDKVSEKEITADDILNHPENQLDIELHDSRGLLQIKQDASDVLTFLTHTATKQAAREYHQLSEIDKNGGVVKIHVDEVKKKYDKEGRDTLTSILRDSVVNQETHKLYSVFGECICEGPDGQGWQLYREFAKNGRVIRTNEHEGIHTIKLGDLNGLDTLQLQSAKEDLSVSPLDKLDELIAKDRDLIERTETVRDKRGRPLTMKAPIWHIKNIGLPTRTYEYDRWDNPIHEVDSRGCDTFRVYNHENKEIRTLMPNVDAPAEGGVLTVQRPEILHGYNERGFYIGTRDGNKHASGVILDDAGQWITKIDAEGVRVERRQIDIFGNTLASIDASDRIWRARYNPFNLPIEMEIVQSEYGRRFSYRYDEARHRVSVANPLGTYRYNHDPMGNIIERYLPMGELERRKYGRKNLLEEIAYQDETPTHTTWRHDYFGNVTFHTDVMGEETRYERDRKMQPVHEYSINPKHPVVYRHLNITKLVTRPNTPDMPITSYYPTLHESRSKDIEREFRCGLLMSVMDNLLGKKEKREFDSEGHAEKLSVFQLSYYDIYRSDPPYGSYLPKLTDGLPLTTVSVERDGLNREVKVVSRFMTASGVDSQFELVKIYDLANNLRRKEFFLKPAGYSETCLLQDQRMQRNFSFFDNDYILSIESIMSDEVLAGEPVHRVVFNYAGGSRMSEQHNNGTPVIIAYVPHDLLIEETLLPGVMRTLRTYQSDGAPTSYSEHVSASDRMDRQLIFDINSKLRSDQIWHNGKTKVRSTFAGYGLYSFPKYQESEHYDDAEHAIMKDTFEVNQTTGYESWSASGCHGVRVKYGPGGGTTHADSRMIIDANQTISGKHLSADEHSDDQSFEHNPSESEVFFDSTPSGRILSKHVMESKLGICAGKQSTYYFLQNIDGDMLAAYKELHDLEQQRLHAENHRTPKPGQPHYQPSISFMCCPEPIKLIGRLGWSQTSARNNPLGWDDAPYPSLAPQLYVTAPGDTFESIARKQFGDEEAVVALARENGYLGDYMLRQPLLAGETLFLPQYITQKVKAHHARPYQEFVSQMTGSILPFLKMPMPKPKSDSGSFLRILVKVIAVAIVFAVAPYLGALLVTAVVGTGASLATAVAFNAVAGVALDAGLQGVAMAAGLQDHFSLSQSLSAGIGVGVNTAIFGPVTQFGQTAASMSTPATQAAHVGMATTLLRTAEAAVTTQLLEMATGLRSKFDASAIATQMASTVVAMKVDSKIAGALGKDNPATAPIAGGARAVTGAVISSAVTHTPVNTDVVAAQAIGGMVGGSIESRMQDGWKKSPTTSTTRASAAKSGATASSSHYQPATHSRPLSAHEKHTMAEASEAAHRQLDKPELRLPGKRTDDATYGLSEMNRERLQRSSAPLHSVPRHGSTTADLLRATKAASGESYSYFAQATSVEKVIMAGASAVVATALLPEVAIAVGVRGAMAVADGLGHVAMASMGVPVTESILAAESATMAGGVFLTATAARVKTAVSTATSRSTVFGRSGTGAEKLTQELWGRYRVERELPRDKHGVSIPDSSRPHSQIGQVVSKSKGGYTYTQAREWGYDANGKLIPKRDIDFTDHGTPDIHPNPHQHAYEPNPTGGTYSRSRIPQPVGAPSDTCELDTIITNPHNRF